MCDTMVALGNSTANGQVIFAKNSDRQPNEPHLMIRIPRKEYPANSRLKCTYLEIDQACETYEVLLLKPSWMWGAEMGCNEFGLNIGNEAVFTKEKQGPPSLLGMDMLRIALERCRTSDEALYLIIELLEKYGQGGNCGYEKTFTYHNSFLIADPHRAWVLETAGDYWAAQKVTDIRCISNRLSIGRDYDLAHPQLIDHAIRRGWCRSEEDFHFAKCYSNKLITHFSGSLQRHETCNTALETAKGQITEKIMIDILRCHEPRIQADPFAHSSLKSVCMHGGFIFGDQTTGSYVAALDETLSTYWVTGCSLPCLATFKPYWLTQHGPVPRDDQSQKALEFWLHREKLHRMILENRVTNLTDYLSKRDQLEQDFSSEIQNLNINDITEEQLEKIMKRAWSQEATLVASTIEAYEHNKGQVRGNPYFKRYWKKQNAKLD